MVLTPTDLYCFRLYLISLKLSSERRNKRKKDAEWGLHVIVWLIIILCRLFSSGFISVIFKVKHARKRRCELINFHIVVVKIVNVFQVFNCNFPFPSSRESEGSFQYGNYFREADDLHAVIQHFNGTNHVTTAILGHSKGLLSLYYNVYCTNFFFHRI